MRVSRAAAATHCLVTALATGWQVFQLVMWGVWGRQSHSLDLAGLAGAAILLLGAVIMYGRHTTGAKVAESGCLVLWAFYGPAVWGTAGAVASGRSSLDPLVLLPPFLLVASSVVCAAVVWRGSDKHAEPSVAADRSRM